MRKKILKKEKRSFEERIDALTEKSPAFVRALVVSTKCFVFYHGTIRAGAMTYTSFLALIPLLILLAAITLALGMGTFFSDYLPILNGLFSLNLPLDEIMPMLKNAEQIPLRSLGIIGSSGLLVTFILAIGNLEINMNVVWENHTSRSIAKQLLVYTPLLIVAAGFFGLFAGVVSQFRHALHTVVLAGNLFPIRYIGTLVDVFWMVAFHAGFILLFFIALVWLPFRKDRVSYKKILLPAFLTSIAMWAANSIYITALIYLQSLLIARFSLFYGSLAFIPLALLFVFGFWCIMLYGNGLVWTIYYYPRSIEKKWEWIQIRGNL